MTNIQQHIEDNEKKFDENFFPTLKNLHGDDYIHKRMCCGGDFCDGHEDDRKDLKLFLHSSQLSLLEEVKKIIEGKKMKFDPETTQDIFIDPTAVDGYNQAIEDILKDLTIKE